MIPAQVFRIIAAFHQAVWPLFFLAALLLLIYTWRHWRKGRFVLTWFVYATQLLLVITGFMLLYAYQFDLFFTLKAIVALSMLIFFEKGRRCLKKQHNHQGMVHVTLFFLTAVIVMIMGVYGR
ncbi:hypothetical protein [Shouchella lonarensis]|uniref:Uncharacterized protein n=1 Tax=Shouchella lonarensis TaxID=1464122 RepID=A0A1G6K070_9BACI|nr:hypothetical protein [Shouchella lonarensis]SDC23686.1 hypothetical protein SAMN05421737_106130 [Shouchella lonarensis]